MQRQLWRGIASSHAWRWALAGEGSVLQPAGSLASRMLSSSAPAAQEEGGKSSWMPNWMKSRLPSALGGEREALKEMEDLTLDGYAEGLRRARKLGGITGFAFGSGKAADATAQGSMRLYEEIIGAMTDAEKADLSQFKGEARQRVATQVGCRTEQVDDCIAKYLWMRDMSQRMAQLKRAGQALPTSVEDVERQLGNWRQYKTEAGSSGEGATVPANQLGPGGVRCPLAGTNAGRNTKCPLTGKKMKACCGRQLGKK